MGIGNYNFLVVDDEPEIAQFIGRILKSSYKYGTNFLVSNGIDALEIIKQTEIHLLITDIMMPGITGIDLVKAFKSKYPINQAIIITAFADVALVREGFRYGVYDYIVKPFSLEDFQVTLERAVQHLELLRERQDYVGMLEKRVNEAKNDLNRSFISSLGTLINALDARDRYTHQHSSNVSKYSSEIASLLDLDEEMKDDIRTGGVLHDIGKIGIPDSILLKPDRLTNEEYEIVKRHSELGKRIIYPVMKVKPSIIDFVLYHHERWDGNGYPAKLKGEQIPLPARIAALADAFDTMVSERVYKGRFSLDQAMEEIKRCKGIQFDPEIAQMFYNSY